MVGVEAIPYLSWIAFFGFAENGWGLFAQALFSWKLDLLSNHAVSFPGLPDCVSPVPLATRFLGYRFTLRDSTENKKPAFEYCQN